METSISPTKRKQGKQLLTAEKMALTHKLVELLGEGFYSDNSLANKLGVNTTTIRRYRPYADEIIKMVRLDRNVIRNLQLARVYNLIDGLIHDLENAETTKEKFQIHASIIKYSQHLALITGLNIETQINLSNEKLVIIRPPKIIHLKSEDVKTHSL